ncbi:hypothetical protein BGX34_010456 [Mortierella sp. NVP85]|nr:hypothetical protein BGX34_010456 [Mortierella sp. NVP85]
MEQRKLGTLVAIPIKGRKLVNRSGRKQSPFIELKLGEQCKRTKASLIASAEPEWDQEIRLDVYESFGNQGAMDMSVAMFDEGKRNEKIGEGIFKLHEVIDKGELDVWFPIKHKGATTAEIYFELTYYALAPVTPVSHMPMQRPVIRPGQPGFIPPGASPYSPPPHMPVYGNVPRPQPPFPVAFQQPPPMVYTHNPNPMPYPVPHQQHPMSPPPRIPGPPNGMGFNPPFHVSSPPPIHKEGCQWGCQDLVQDLPHGLWALDKDMGTDLDRILTHALVIITISLGGRQGLW